jgi:outer membrane lipoprotein-sorting protein
MKRALTVVSAAAALVVFTGLAWAGGMANSGSFQRTINIRTTGASAMESENYYWSGDRLRAEKYSINGMIIQIKNGNTLYLYNPAAKEAMKAVLQAKYNKTVQAMLSEEAGAAKSGKKVGSTKVAGFACDVYMVSKSAGGVTKRAKLYMCRDPRLPVPLKLELTIGKVSQTIETKNIKLNPSISSSMFSLPRGVKVTEQKMNPSAFKPAPGAKKK